MCNHPEVDIYDGNKSEKCNLLKNDMAIYCFIRNK